MGFSILTESTPSIVCRHTMRPVMCPQTSTASPFFQSNPTDCRRTPPWSIQAPAVLAGYAPSGPPLYRGIQGSSSGCSPCPACLHSWASGSSTSHYPSLRQTPTVPRAKLRSQTVLARGCSRHCLSHSPHRGFLRALSSLSCHAVDGLLAPKYQVCNTPLSLSKILAQITYQPTKHLAQK